MGSEIPYLDAYARAEKALADSEERERRYDDCYLPGSDRSDAAKLRTALRDLIDERLRAEIALLAAEPATERETRLEAAYQREHARLTEVLGALSEVLPPGAEIRPALLALKARAEAAESRARRLAEALREIESRTGHFGEAPPPPEWMPMLSLIAWVGKTARATLAEVGK